MADTIICPWCGHSVAQGDLCDYGRYMDGSTHETECEKCDKPILVTGEVELNWTTEKDSNVR